MPSRRRLSRRRPGEQLGFWWWLTIVVLYLPVGLITKLHYRHDERIPLRGPAILVVNHVSHIDPVLVCRLVLDVGRVPRFLAKDSIFSVPVVGQAMAGMGHVPVRRGTADARHSLSAAVGALRDGRVIVLHPEGTVTRDPGGWPMVARTGIGRLALLMPDVPVIPIGQWGVQQSYDLYRKRIRPLPRRDHTLSVGDPVDLSEFRGADPSVATITAVTDRVMRAVRIQVADARGLPAPAGPLFDWDRKSRP